MFRKFRDAVEAQFNTMAESGDLFVMDLNKDDVWDKYMDSFPAGTNEIYRECREYDCSTCKSFIRRIGNVVAIIDGKIVTVWDVEVDGYYKDVAKALKKYVKKAEIRTVFLHDERKVGNESNVELLDDDTTKTWEHFSCNIPTAFFTDSVAEKRGKIESRMGVFKRSMEELSISSAEVILDLILQNSLYRGEEHQDAIESFVRLKEQYDDAKHKDRFLWSNRRVAGNTIKNSVIGTLLEDLSSGVDINTAVKSFETKVAPANYKRTSAPITKGMISKAVEKIDELGLKETLERRFAVIEDISITNVLFADRASTPKMKDSIEAMLEGEVKVTNDNFDKLEEMNINDFVRTVLPNISEMSVLVKNAQVGNFVSLVAPKVSDAPKLFKWDNDFSWSYNGEIADSMKERVKSLGGDIEGVLRFSIQWNDKMNDSSNDLDAHCQHSSGEHIMYSNKRGGRTHGRLDVDITRPNGEIAVENITWAKKVLMKDGEYKFYVHNYSGRNTDGFTAEIEIDGVIHSFSYPRSVASTVVVATVTLKQGVFSIKPELESSMMSKEVWGVQTETFQKVSTMMMSPNFWDEQEIGNRHFFFMLENCVNPNRTRGFYNEFLRNDLTEHRKVFEVLSGKMSCEHTDEQLSGVGFSSTGKGEVIVKVGSTFNRILKLKF